ncbi:dihydrodipicolinate synthase family protein [Variovorax sp. KBS0712]|jgi:4-hydroxy-tetrahydrodipicolinate synthase|uniref:dihydrodipicolinate synthase family protein n=1 Tax=unclassified Variovorax TaxID=663243 RepID=UPI00111A4B4E|nr:dihydrodipicolinate synthase family protein [Variovorax sp. KBS0712]TSD56915.1 dihydrodipicolinate synthase family protein [Variovorax sp. KBS0712]
MARYHRSEAREWAREHLVGVANVTIPTMTSDFTCLNEKAIRHDVNLTIEHGFVGSLAVSEVPLSFEEHDQFQQLMVDEAKGRLIVVHHAVFNTLEDNIAAVKRAEANGAELVLLGYPPHFYPKSYEEVYQYSKAMCDATNLAVMLFPVPIWGFSRLHPADIPVPVLRRLVDDCPNVAAIKTEGGMPYIMSAIECHREFHKEVVISSPLEYEYIPLAQVMDIPFCGTNYSAFFGPWIPRAHKLIREGKFNEATEIFYKLDPMRKAVATVGFGGHALSNRLMWKYQSWLQGYNGGPIRHPTARVHGRDMAMLRNATQAAGLNPTTDPDEAFFVGRNPV